MVFVLCRLHVLRANKKSFKKASSPTSLSKIKTMIVLDCELVVSGGFMSIPISIDNLLKDNVVEWARIEFNEG